MNILTFIVIVLFVTIIVNLFFKRLNISLIVGYIISGAFLGTFMDFSNQVSKENMSHIGEFGVVFLMFTIGLEFSLSHLKKMQKEVLLHGGLQVVITSTLFTYLFYTYLNFDIKMAIIVSSAISLSSTALVVKALSQNSDIHRPYGRYAFGILLFHDLAVIPILLMITFFSTSEASIGKMLFDTLTSAVGIVVIMYLFGKFFLDKFLEMTLDNKNEELFISAILLIVLASSTLAYSLGFTYSLGAFVAGMLISETKYKYKVEADLSPFRDLLLGLFFITVGLQLDITLFTPKEYLIISIYTVVILAIKAIIMFVILYFFMPARRATKVSLVLAHLGSFSFVIFAYGHETGLISDIIYQKALIITVLSLIITSLFIKSIRPFVDRLVPQNQDRLQVINTEILDNHVIVCGYSVLGQQVVKRLKKKKIECIAIEKNLNLVKNGLDYGDDVYLGNAMSIAILENCYIKNAKAVILTIDDDKARRLIIETINQIDSNIQIISKISHQIQIDDLKDLKVKSFVNENNSTAGILIQKALES
jgi:CPA2 family monovalent cation:H+ antiporter-2